MDSYVKAQNFVVLSQGHLRPPGNSLYARLGGVYPIALFADRLIDAMLEDSRVNVPVDGSKRSAASIKYLFTEVVCTITGGPEVITSEHLEETRVLLSTQEFFYFVVALNDAADHIPDQRAVCELSGCVYDNMHLIVDPKRETPWTSACASGDSAVRTHLQMKQALEKAANETGAPRCLYFAGAGVSTLPLDAQGRRPTAKATQAFRTRLTTLGFGGGVRTSVVKSAAEASRGGGDRGA